MRNIMYNPLYSVHLSVEVNNSGTTERLGQIMELKPLWGLNQIRDKNNNLKCTLFTLIKKFYTNPKDCGDNSDCMNDGCCYDGVCTCIDGFDGPYCENSK